MPRSSGSGPRCDRGVRQCRPNQRIAGRLDADPLVRGLRPDPNIGAEVICHEVSVAGPKHKHEVVLAPSCHNFGQQQILLRPAEGEQLVALGDRVIMALTGSRRDQPDFSGKALCIGLRNNGAIDRGVDALKFGPPFGRERHSAFDRYGLVDLTVVSIFEAKNRMRNWRKGRRIKLDARNR